MRVLAERLMLREYGEYVDKGVVGRTTHTTTTATTPPRRGVTERPARYLTYEAAGRPAAIAHSPSDSCLSRSRVAKVRAPV